MLSYFNLSIRFLNQAFHGRKDGGKPEWPPSPLRLFQSLVAAAAAQRRLDALTPALTWLEQQSAPTLIAPLVASSDKTPGYCISVPNNEMDVVAKAWCRGNYSDTGDASPATHRTMKTVHPTLLIGDSAVQYLWPLSNPLTDEVRTHVDMLCDIARSIVTLGWGIDMVVGHGAIISYEQADELAGERWLPSNSEKEDRLRVPVKGTLDALKYRHKCYLDRFGSNGFTAPPPLSVYDTVYYRGVTDLPDRPVAAFSLLKLDASGFRVFDTARQSIVVAGMMRHTTALTAKQVRWSESEINSFILGHGESKDDTKHIPVGPQRFAYLPLPSIESRGAGNTRVVGDVRRVILSSFANDCEKEISWARRSISGQELIQKDEKQPVALLSLIPGNDRVVQYYTRRSSTWATVTPVVLPGYDDNDHCRQRLKHVTNAEEQKKLLYRLDNRIEGLIRKAITQAGYAQILADHAEIEWCKVGFWPGTDLADRYGVPDHLRRFPRLHVKLHWRDAYDKPVEVPGPICLGGGRFYGMGLFAALPPVG